MPRNARIVSGLALAALLFTVSLPGEAAAKEKEVKPKPKAPIVIEADEIYFSDLTGNMFAKGKVVINQDPSRLTGELVRGNTKQNDVWIDDHAHFAEPGVNLDGSQMHYNYGSRTGTIEGRTTGKIGRDFVVGRRVEFLPGEYLIFDGTMTMCNAKVPDYHVSATKVEIWPDDKLIAYNAKFWIKDKVIYTMPKYQRSLRKDAKSEFPSVGYTNGDGLYIKQYLEYPVGDKIAVFTDLDYYSKRGFEPIFGVINRENDYNISITQGNFRDSDDRWIKKEPELKVDFFSHRVGSLPVSYKFYAIYGKWTESAKSSWHQDYSIYFSRDTIKLSDTLQLTMGTGLQHIRESYDGTNQNIFRYDVGLYKTWSPRFNAFIGYHYAKNNQTLFKYNSIDLARQLDVGFTYKIDRLNTIGFVQTYDLNRNRIYDQDITWYRNLHCWQTTITYRVKRSELIWSVALAKF